MALAPESTLEILLKSTKAKTCVGSSAFLPRIFRMIRLLLLASAFSSLGVISGFAQTIWNPTTAFSINNGNPNGVWSYGWMDTGFPAFVLYTGIRVSGADQGGSSDWYRTPSGDFTPAIWRNTGPGTYYHVAPGQLSLHPSSTNQPSVLRWTAPSDFSGSVEIIGQFLPGDSGSMQVAVRQGNTELFHAVNSGAFHFTRAVSPNDTLDFAVYGGYAAGNTPLELQIIGTPASSSDVPVAPRWALGVMAVLLVLIAARYLPKVRFGDQGSGL